ncbi:MAG TPA: phosphoglycerate mutase family protein [Beijerinckiaceae bacterium]|jgi:broad specificity phosphatase PhoE
MRVLTLILATVPASAPAFAQQAVILVRHAEQALVGGMMDGDPPLTEEGSRRAKVLAGALKDAGVKAIFVSQYVRSQETAAPLAAALGSPVQVVAKDDLTELSDRLRQQHASDTVLVVGHSDTIPALLKNWGHTAPVEIGRREFDSVWLVVPRTGQAPIVSRLRLP